MSHFLHRIFNATYLLFFLFFMLWIAAPIISLAQTILTPGDIILVTIETDGNNCFDFVPLIDLSPNTVIKFTDNAWDNSSHTLQSNEGVITYTTATAISAGAIISYDGSDNNGFAKTDPGFNISGSGDNILVYKGDDNNPVFLYGAGFAKDTSTVWSYDGGENTSDIPLPLNKSSNTTLSLPLGTDNILQYGKANGTEGTEKSLLALVSNEQNWNRDNEFEEQSTPVFHLRDETAAASANTKTNPLTTNGNEEPPVVINEILAAPPAGLKGDTNRDGIREEEDDKFIELVNTHSKSIDISGWQLSNDGKEDISYTFPSGTILSANQSIVVFGGGSPIGGFGGAIVQSSDSLDLDDTQGKVSLLDDRGILIQSVTYGGNDLSSSNRNESMTRNPDITGNFEVHAIANSDNRSPFSPGTKINGTAFGSTYAFNFRGSEGWRFIASPTGGTTFSDLLGNLRTQGIPGSDVPSTEANIFSWDESGGGLFKVIGSMSDPLSTGKGYIIYIYEDDDPAAPGIQGEFPKIIHTNNSENASSVEVNVSSTDKNNDGNINGNEGYNLLGNPFGTSISVDAVLNALEDVNPNVNKKVYIWDDRKGNQGDYRILSQGTGQTIAPFQAFFVRYTKAISSRQTVTFDRGNLAGSKDTKFYNEPAGLQTELELHLSDGQKFDSYKLEFSKKGETGEDLYDGYKLFSLNKEAIQLFSSIGNDIKLAQNELPPIESIDGELRIPLGYQVPRSGEYTISWDDLSAIPEGFKLYLIDNKTGHEIDMQASHKLAFHVISRDEQTKEKKSYPGAPEPENKNRSINSRFQLLLTNASTQQKPQETQEEAVKLSPNYPNPFSSQTTMNLRLKEKMHVKMTIWNIVGQKITTIVDKIMDPGATHPMRWNVPGNLPSGIYICKVEAGGKILTRKMTLVK